MLKTAYNKNPSDGSKIPAIRFSGSFLADLGFVIGEDYEVTINDDKSLTIRSLQSDWNPVFRDPETVLRLAKEYWGFLSEKERELEAGFPARCEEARALGHLPRPLFLDLARWKSARKIHDHERNSEDTIRIASAMAFKATSEDVAIGALVQLEGVALRTATALLHWMRPEEYPILDFRVLESMGEPAPQSFEEVPFYSNIAAAVREQAATLGVNLRTFDRALWTWSKKRNRLKGSEPPARAIADDPSKPGVAADPGRTADPADAGEPEVDGDPPTAQPLGHDYEVGERIPCRITNIASKAERAKGNDRYELCIPKSHRLLFPEDKGQITVQMGERGYVLELGVKAGVDHIYVKTRTLSDIGERGRITEVLQHHGFSVGDRPTLVWEGEYRFRLEA